jgi:hypothetical protein
VNAYLTFGVAALLVLLIIVLGWSLRQRRRQTQRNASLQNLLDLADRLEADLKPARCSARWWARRSGCRCRTCCNTRLN